MEVNLVIRQKVFDFEKNMYGYLSKYPRHERLTLVAETKNTIHRINRQLSRAAKAEKKRAMLYDADAELDLLKHLVELGYELHYLSKTGHQVCMIQLAEIGKMLGGWIGSIKTKKEDN